MRSFACAAMALLCLAGTLRAQSRQAFSVQLSGLFVIPAGSAFTGTDAGPGAELQLRRNSSPISYGVGVQYSRHDIGIESPMSLTGVFVEPRYVLCATCETVFPYVSGRGAVFRQGVSSEGTSGSATGVQVNGGGGLLIVASPNINLDVGATLGLLYFGEFTTRYAGSTYTSSAASGINLVLRAGVVIGIGR